MAIDLLSGPSDIGEMRDTLNALINQNNAHSGVTSVNGQTGDVTLTGDDVSGASKGGNLAATNQSAIFSLTLPTASVPSYIYASNGNASLMVDALALVLLPGFTGTPSNLSPKKSVRVSTVAALDADYDNGTLGVGATLTNNGAQAGLEIDGVTLDNNDLVLVKDQAAGAQNGIYKVTDKGDGMSDWVLTRDTTYDQAADISLGNYTVALEGDDLAGAVFVQSATGPFTIGTTAITFMTATQIFSFATAGNDSTISQLTPSNSWFDVSASQKIYAIAIANNSAQGTVASFNGASMSIKISYTQLG